MTADQLLIKTAKILETLKIPYAVTGGVAVAFWGKPRFTADIDIIIELEAENISPLAKLLLSIDKDVYVSEEAMRDALKRKGEFNFVHPQTGLKVDFWVKDTKADIYGKLKIEKAIAQNIDGQKVFFISPEDLILSKLFWYRESQSPQHLEDIKTIFDIQKSKLDLKYIKTWAEKQSTIKILERLL